MQVTGTAAVHAGPVSRQSGNHAPGLGRLANVSSLLLSSSFRKEELPLLSQVAADVGIQVNPPSRFLACPPPLQPSNITISPEDPYLENPIPVPKTRFDRNHIGNFWRIICCCDGLEQRSQLIMLPLIITIMLPLIIKIMLPSIITNKSINVGFAEKLGGGFTSKSGNE
ncbi:S-adenosyl-L-methionine-dependentmethyltransferases superfamily protein [Striga asiatica]|uniref:S-adenosyl-L-methionine-dependentmethyltransferases superfamily protein n=1 Tax=Striga asiatica TaxID=4170 RepID=A0A5A7PW15_STRAF|nr:S-adenosyl-L-methionine-dependentmethyltransferases superfamily protein [Striga asiatica]